MPKKWAWQFSQCLVQYNLNTVAIFILTGFVEQFGLYNLPSVINTHVNLEFYLLRSFFYVVQ